MQEAHGRRIEKGRRVQARCTGRWVGDYQIKDRTDLDVGKVAFMIENRPMGKAVGAINKSASGAGRVAGSTGGSEERQLKGSGD